MKTPFALFILIALLLSIAAASITAAKLEAALPATAPPQSIPASQPGTAGKGAELATLEQKLLGTWHGPACGGDYTFNPDGTFDVQHLTPGQLHEERPHPRKPVAFYRAV